MFFLKVAILFILPSFISADQFSHETSVQMADFVAASFTPFMGHDYDPVYACYEKNYPKGGWYVLNAFDLQPCKIKDECVLWILSSNIYKMIVFTFKGAIGKYDMNQTAHESFETYVPFLIGNVSYGQVNPDIFKASTEAFDYISGLILGHRSYSFVFTGHSLGGSIASLTALNVKIAYPTVNLSLYTFGEPRYHNYELAQAFQNNLPDGYRIVHNDDIILHMPICSSDTFSGSCKKTNNSFYHRAQEIWYNNPTIQMNDGDQKLCGISDGEDLTCSNSIPNEKFLLNFETDRGAEMHMTYHNQKLDDYGLSGCGEIPCVDVDTDCASRIKDCNNSLYKPVMCKYCKKSCNLCTDRKCYN